MNSIPTFRLWPSYPPVEIEYVFEFYETIHIVIFKSKNSDRIHFVQLGINF